MLARGVLALLHQLGASQAPLLRASLLLERKLQGVPDPALIELHRRTIVLANPSGHYLAAVLVLR